MSEVVILISTLITLCKMGTKILRPGCNVPEYFPNVSTIPLSYWSMTIRVFNKRMKPIARSGTKRKDIHSLRQNQIILSTAFPVFPLFPQKEWFFVQAHVG